jgi:hypothetical protein
MRAIERPLYCEACNWTSEDHSDVDWQLFELWGNNVFCNHCLQHALNTYGTAFTIARIGEIFPIAESEMDAYEIVDDEEGVRVRQIAVVQPGTPLEQSFLIIHNPEEQIIEDFEDIWYEGDDDDFPGFDMAFIPPGEDPVGVVG